MEKSKFSFICLLSNDSGSKKYKICKNHNLKNSNRKIHYVCYIDNIYNIDFIQNSIKERFKENLTHSKEWLENVELITICEFIQNFCKLMNYEYKEAIYDEELKQNLISENKIEEIYSDSDSESEIDDDFFKKKKELDEKYNFKEIRKLCKELNLIQLGNKNDMIERIIKHRNKLHEHEKQEQDIQNTEDEEEKDNTFIYQYNNKGIFIAKYRNMSELKRNKDITATRKEIQECLENKRNKAGDFIFTNVSKKFSSDELKEINQKNKMIILKLDKDGNEIERYDTIMDAATKNNLSRGIIDRAVASGAERNGFYFKILNKENKVKQLTEDDKKNMLKDFNDNEFTIDEMCKKYKRVRKYMKVLLKKLGADLTNRV